MNACMARLIKENRMADNTNLIPAAELAAKNKAHFPNESPEYREARNHLLSEEIELRRHVERVAALRRALPPGGEIPEDYMLKDPMERFAFHSCSATRIGEHGISK